MSEPQTRTLGDGQTVPADIFETACGIVMNAKSLKSMSRHTDVVDAIALALLAERWKSIEAGATNERYRLTRSINGEL